MFSLFRKRLFSTNSRDIFERANFFLKQNKFRPHTNGNQNLFGIFQSDCDSTISYLDRDGTNTTWRMLFLGQFKNTAYYIDEHNRTKLFDFNDSYTYSSTTRLEPIKK